MSGFRQHGGGIGGRADAGHDDIEWLGGLRVFIGMAVFTLARTWVEMRLDAY